MADLPRFVLVAGTVYRRTARYRRRSHDIEYRYLRASVPPDFTPGKRSKARGSYQPYRLPAHEVLDDAQAKTLINASVERLTALYANTETTDAE
jgi:hypothetical protein